MKNLLFPALSTSLFLFAGCTTIENPMIHPIEERDNAIYEAGKTKTERKEEKRHSLDVYVDCGAIAIERTHLSADEAADHLSTSITAYLRSRLQKFPFFRVMADDSIMAKLRARRMANAVESGEEPEISQRGEAEYIILGKIDSVMVHGDGGVANSSTAGGTGMGLLGIMTRSPTAVVGGAAGAVLGNALEPNVVDISMSFEFYNCVTDTPISTESITRKYSGNSKDNTGAMILAAARDCVDEYAAILNRDYVQEARVLQTRGNAKYAWISLGTKDGIVPGTKVMFYEFLDMDDIMDSWTHEKLPIAYGEVIGIPDDKTCWVEVEKSSSVHVKKFHFVKVISVPKKNTLLERVGL